MLNKVLSLTFSTWWMGYLFVVNQLDVLHIYQSFQSTPTTGFLSTFVGMGIVSTVASVATIVVVSLYFLLLISKILVPLTYFALSFSFYFKLVSLGFVGSTLYLSFAYLSLYGFELYFQMLRAKLHWFLFFVYGEIKMLGFLLELMIEAVKPLFSSKLLDSGDPSFSSDEGYQKSAQDFFELGVHPFKVVSEKLKVYANSFQKQQQPPKKQDQQEEEEILEKFVVRKSCFLFEMEMENVFEEGCKICTIDDINIVEIPFHGLGLLLLLGLRCLLVKNK